MEKRYSISDASKQVMVENHVLRYWEEELGLVINRNSKGHRYYTDRDILILREIKDLKEQGFQLRAIKLVLPDIDRIKRMAPGELYQLREELNQQVQEEEEQRGHRTDVVVPLGTVSGKNVAAPRKVSEEKLRKFEGMLRQMIENVVNEGQKETEERICESVSTRLLKEMDYVMRQKEEVQDKQIALLQEILKKVNMELPEVAASGELKTIKTKKGKRKVDKPNKRKLFAK